MKSTEAILGGVIRDYQDIWVVAKAAGFSQEIFDDGKQKEVAKAVITLSEKNIPVDLMTISEILPQEYLGYLIDLLDNAPITVNYEFLIRQVASWKKLKSIAFDMRVLSERILKASVSEASEGYVNQILELYKNAEEACSRGVSAHTVKESLESAIERIRDRIEDSLEGKKNGYLSNLKTLDSYISGFRPGRVYIVAARTSVGKTTFSSYLALQAIKQGAIPLFFSNEMDKEDLIEKWISSEGGVSNLALQSGDFRDDQLDRFTKGCKAVAAMQGLIDEKSGWNLNELQAVAYTSKNKFKTDLIIVDYLQQVRVKGSTSKHEQVSIASDAMKKMARDLNVPVIVLAQINRESEKSGKPMMPSLANLKDSGSIEQDADVVMILHKDDISFPAVELLVAKNRYGKTGKISLDHIFPVNAYQEVDPRD